jgi:hypothetical protein
MKKRIPVAVRCKVQDSGRSFAKIAVQIPLGAQMFVSAVQVVSSAAGRSLVQESPTECVSVSQLCVTKYNNNHLHIQLVK